MARAPLLKNGGEFRARKNSLLLFKEEWLRAAQTRWLLKSRSVLIDIREALLIECSGLTISRQFRRFDSSRSPRQSNPTLFLHDPQHPLIPAGHRPGARTPLL